MAIPSNKEAITGARRLYRRAMGRPFPGKVVITSGNRYTWVRRGVMYVNPNPRWGMKGWRGIVHLMAHYCHSRKHPNARPHDHRELDLEADLTRYAIESGFHEGRLKRPETPPKPKPNIRTVRMQNAEAALRRWESKQKRTETAIKKYRRKVSYYEKALSG
jgi:hypothetical protein